MTCIQIVDWGKHYENNRTRELKRMTWVPLPNKHDGDGYTELISEHPNGPAHYGAWCALLGVASKCLPRGTLVRQSGEPHDEVSLARITHIPADLWKEALPRLAKVGWIAISDGVTSQEGAGIPQEGADDVAGECRPSRREVPSIPHPTDYRTEQNGTEGKGTEQTEPAASSAPFSPASAEDRLRSWRPDIAHCDIRDILDGMKKGAVEDMGFLEYALRRTDGKRPKFPCLYLKSGVTQWWPAEWKKGKAAGLLMKPAATSVVDPLPGPRTDEGDQEIKLLAAKHRNQWHQLLSEEDRKILLDAGEQPWCGEGAEKEAPADSTQPAGDDPDAAVIF